MEIRILGNYDFTDGSDNCVENGNLSIMYEVPITWKKWSDKMKETWLRKNENKIQKHFRDSMCVVACVELEYILEEDEF